MYGNVASLTHTHADAEKNYLIHLFRGQKNNKNNFCKTKL